MKIFKCCKTDETGGLAVFNHKMPMRSLLIHLRKFRKVLSTFSMRNPLEFAID